MSHIGKYLDILQNLTVFEWSGDISHGINQVNSERAVAVG